MADLLDQVDAQTICKQLLNTPVAPGVYSHLINVGTNEMLDVLEKNYFDKTLADGISCFKYVQGYYGSGKTQFIHSLAARAWRNQIVTSIVDIGNDCPFNSPLAIFRAVMSSFLPPPQTGREPGESRGIEVVIDYWMRKKLRSYGLSDGQQVDPQIRAPIQKVFSDIFLGARDVQVATGIKALGKVFLDLACGGSAAVTDEELIAWMRGSNIRSKGLKDSYGLSEVATEQNAFARLMTIISFLRVRLGFKGFLIAFDEGTRTASFRRGSAKQKQAIENMLTLINKNRPGEFSGVMFLYAATPDFRSDVVSKYVALNDRIGDISFSPGSPMVPFIDLDALNTEEIVREIGAKLLELFSVAYGIHWDMQIQQNNVEALLDAEKNAYGIGSEIRRAFVYHFCIFLDNLWQTRGEQQRIYALTPTEAADLVSSHRPPKIEEN